MSETTLFISDLHLDPAREHIQDLFLEFLARWRGQARALYILGDLFEAWVGDDAVAGDEPVITAMAAFSAHTPLYLMHGNRDFLLGSRFCELTGARLLADPTLIDLHGVPTLVMHGDSLCTGDEQYQALRGQLRSEDWQAQFLAQPLPVRRAMAQDARQQSSARNQGLEDYLMDVNQTAVEKVMREHATPRLIHGHTHRPAVHDFSIDGRPVQRIVLGDWYDQGSVLEVTDAGCRLRSLAP